MKRSSNVIGIVLLLLLCHFVACNSKKQVPEPVEGPSKELSAIDSLMWQQPDSAFAMLQEFVVSPEAEVLDTFNWHYCQLLISELLYKNDYEQTNREELLQSVSYFDSLVRQTPPFKGDGGIINVISNSSNIPFLAARAHYINGVGYYENDSAVEACKEYMKALETMQDHFEEKELVGKKAQFMALTYTHLTGLFSDLYFHEQAILFGKSSLHYYNKYGAQPWHIAWIMDEIGIQYEMMDNYDTANMLYLEALQLLPDTNNITCRDIATRLAYLSYKKGESPEKALKQLHIILSQAGSENEFFSRCMCIGEIYYHEAQLDSAWYYLGKAFLGSQSVNSKKQAAEWLVQICKAQGKESEVMEYANYLVPFANVEENQSTKKSQLAELYKSYTQQEQERLHRQEKLKNFRWLIVIVGSLLVLMLSYILLYHNSRKKKQHLETQIEAERQAHNMQQKALSGKLKKSNEALHDALQQLDSSSSYCVIQSEPKKDYNSFVEAPICRHILDTVQHNFKSKINFINYKEYALQREQLLALRVAADENMDGFTVRLRKHFHGLTDDDATYCCLYLLDISDSDIAALMQKAYSTVCERKRKIKRIVGGEDQLSYTLRNLP